MISSWIPVEDERHEFYGTITKHQIVGNTPSIGMIFEIVPKMYNSFQIKRIYQDKVKKEDTNLAIIRAASIGAFGSRKWNWEDIKKWCDWCLDNDIQPVLDENPIL